MKPGENKKPTSRPNDEAAVLAAVLGKIAAMPAPYCAMGERLHALILRSAPALQPTVWYGMPAYAKDGKTVCFFRADKKYMTFGFTQEANLTPEEGAPHLLIESAWYFTALDDPTEARLSAIVRKLASSARPVEESVAESVPESKAGPPARPAKRPAKQKDK